MNTWDRYRATYGEEGHYWQGALILLLTTNGRRSGEARTTPLVYGRRGDDLLIVASRGGTDEPPPGTGISGEPGVGVQVNGDIFRARARTFPYQPFHLWQERTRREAERARRDTERGGTR